MATISDGLVQFGVEADKSVLNMWKTTGGSSRPLLDVEGFDQYGYPSRNPRPGYEYAWGVYVNPPNIRPGNLLLKWDGQATWNANGQTFGSLVSSGTQSKVLTPPSYMDYPNASTGGEYYSANTSILFKITGVGNTPPSNIRLCYEDQEAALEGGQVFSDEWLETVDRLNPKILRWLNSPSGSNAFCYDYDQMSVEADMKWTGSKYMSADWVTSCSFDTGTQTYNAVKSGFSLAHGAMVHIRIPARPSTKIFYLNVEGTGAKAVRPAGFHDPDVGSSADMIPRAGGVCTFMYHSLFDSWIVAKGNVSGSTGSALETQGYDVGIPLSVKVAICNTLGTDLWWNPAYLACDTFNPNYFTSVFTYVRDNLNPGLKLWVEGPNESWNSGAGGAFKCTFAFSWCEAYRYPSTYLSTVRAQGYAFSTIEDAYGRCISKMGEVLESVYGAANKGVKYELVIGNQTAQRYDFPGRYKSTNYVSGNAAGDGAGLPATNYATRACITNYYNSSVYGSGGASGTAATTWAGWANMLYYINLWWNNQPDPNDTSLTAQDLQNRRNTQLRAIRYITDGMFTTQPWQRATSYGAGFYDYIKIRHDAIWTKHGLPTVFYEGGNSPDWFAVDPTINVTGTAPDGSTLPAVTGIQDKTKYDGVTGIGIRQVQYMRASKYDPKLRWVSYVKDREMAGMGHSSYPARYFQSGDSGAWSSYDPSVNTVRYLTGDSYPASNLTWKFPNLMGPCEATKGSEDYSNGRFVMLIKT